MAKTSPTTTQRQNARRAADTKSKPYARHHRLSSPSPLKDITISSSSSNASLSSESGSDSSKDKHGFPTYTQYKLIENRYLDSLSDKKREKALISQAMFDSISDVLHNPGAREIGTPQFRFWVRKMFALTDPQEVKVLNSRGTTATISDVPVVIHNSRPVAVKEQLYEIFTYCHGRSGHAGRDKTCALIHQHYSWVPKELTAQFIKACPTCAYRRNGNMDLFLSVQLEVLSEKDFVPTPRLIPVYFGEGPHAPVIGSSRSNSSISSSKNSVESEDSISSYHDKTPMLVDLAEGSVSSHQTSRFLSGLPSQHAGIPRHRNTSQLVNWPTPDLHSSGVLDESDRSDGRMKIGALLSCDSLSSTSHSVFKPNALSASQVNPNAMDMDDQGFIWIGAGVSLPPLLQGLQDGTLSGEEPVLPNSVHATDTLPPSLQPLKLFTPQSFLGQIDPILMDLQGESSISSDEADSPMDTSCSTSPLGSPSAPTVPAIVIMTSEMPKATFTRRAAPPVLNFAPVNFTRHRNIDDDSPTTPESVGSCYSQFSFQPGSATSTDPSPFSTALPTPVAEYEETAKELAAVTDGLLLGEKINRVEVDENDVGEQMPNFPTMMNLAQG